ncbi:MAG: M15 family metallopeptidase [Spirochaetes bacterium]|nr:M15 family metallopeptidase [Spirochaetota bacterium]
MKKTTVRILLLLSLSFISPVFAGNIITDSNMSIEEAFLNVNPDCPYEILENQSLIELIYYGYDGRLHKGQVVMDYRLADDLKAVFRLALKMKFPIAHAVPISAPAYFNGTEWDDNLSMADNNTSGFNYRKAYKQKNLSKHAYGYAIDINPFDNPYITKNFSVPPGAVYDRSKKGTFYTGHPIVIEFKRRGWTWGGDWANSKDYQHFQKVPSDSQSSKYKNYIKWDD